MSVFFLKIWGWIVILNVSLRRRNLNYFSSAYAAAVSAVDPDAGHGELVIKVPAELWKQGDGREWKKKKKNYLEKKTIKIKIWI